VKPIVRSRTRDLLAFQTSRLVRSKCPVRSGILPAISQRGPNLDSPPDSFLTPPLQTSDLFGWQHGSAQNTKYYAVRQPKRIRHTVLASERRVVAQTGKRAFSHHRPCAKKGSLPATALEAWQKFRRARSHYRPQGRRTNWTGGAPHRVNPCVGNTLRSSTPYAVWMRQKRRTTNR